MSGTTAGSTGGFSESVSLAFTTPAAPRVDSTTVTNVSAKFADLRAQIDPLGAATSYYFEYGPTTAYGSDTPALTPEAPYGVSIGSGGLTGGAVESVLQHVGPLTAGGTYHFRVVAESEIEGRAEVVYGPDGVFTTLPLSGEG